MNCWQAAWALSCHLPNPILITQLFTFLIISDALGLFIVYGVMYIFHLTIQGGLCNGTNSLLAITDPLDPDCMSLLSGKCLWLSIIRYIGMVSTTATRDRTEKLGITLPISLLKQIENKRGDIPRSTFIRRAVENYVK